MRITISDIDKATPFLYGLEDSDKTADFESYLASIKASLASLGVSVFKTIRANVFASQSSMLSNTISSTSRYSIDMALDSAVSQKAALSYDYLGSIVSKTPLSTMQFRVLDSNAQTLQDVKDTSNERLAIAIMNVGDVVSKCSKQTIDLITASKARLSASSRNSSVKSKTLQNMAASFLDTKRLSKEIDGVLASVSTARTIRSKILAKGMTVEGYLQLLPEQREVIANE